MNNYIDQSILGIIDQISNNSMAINQQNGLFPGTSSVCDYIKSCSSTICQINDNSLQAIQQIGTPIPDSINDVVNNLNLKNP